METRTDIFGDGSHTAPTKSGKFGFYYSLFKTSFPEIAERVIKWGRHDACSIELELGNHQKFIYSYRGEFDWCLQTKKNYLNSLKVRGMEELAK